MSHPVACGQEVKHCLRFGYGALQQLDQNLGVQADARRLLESLGAWDRYGKKGWGAHKSRASIFAGAQLRAKAASEAFSIHYTPDLLARVRKMYAMDYALLKAVDAME